MLKVVLIGNPNTGKTTVFNSLTNSNEKASNWHGVTVGVKSKIIKFDNNEIEVVDLPGMYSLNNRVAEEKISSNYLEKNKDAVIVNVCDVNNLKRNLLLMTELVNQGYNVIVAVNMINENKDYNLMALEKAIGVSVVGVDGRNKKSVELLLKMISKSANKTQKTSNSNKKQLKYDQIIDFLSKNQNYKIKNKSDKIDGFLLNKLVFVLIFFALIFFIFYITFGPFGNAISQIFNIIFSKIFNNLRKIIKCTNISYIIKMFINEGLFVALEGVLSFIPQILILSICINIIEDIGLMSRVAFMFDGYLKKFGLNGKVLFSILMGYGCTTSAVMTTRNIENINLRKRAVYILPFVSCSAKMPIFLVISSLFFQKYKYLFVFALYLISLFLTLIFAMLYKKIIPDNENLFIYELPKYRMCNLKKIFKDSVSLIVEFVIKVGTTILFVSSIVWILRNFSLDFKYLDGKYFSQSILFKISNKLTDLFSPIGLANAGIIVSLLLGVMAKEMIVVGFVMINSVDVLNLSTSLIDVNSICSFSVVTSIVFLIFVLIYSPCLSALSVIKNELGFKSAIYVFVFQFLVAYLISFVVFQCMTNFKFIIALLVFLILDICVIFMLKLKRKFKCRGNCCACRKI